MDEPRGPRDVTAKPDRRGLTMLVAVHTIVDCGLTMRVTVSIMGPEALGTSEPNLDR